MIETKFKHTDIGLVPEDWEVKTLSEVCSFQTDNILTSDINMSEYVGTENMVPNRGGVLPFVGTLPYYRVRHYLKNDVLTSNIRPYLKKIWLSTREGGCSSDVLVIRANNIFLIPSYLYSVISSDSFFAYSNDNAKGTKMPRGDKDAISKYTFAIPPISEQQRIASALMNIDTLISNLDKLIAKKQAIKKGAMQELLTGKKRLPGFKGEWKATKLGIICNLYGRIGFRGYTRADLVEKGHGAITFSPSDIHNSKLDLEDCDYISLQKYEESPEIKVYNGDILFCKTASIGKCALVENLTEKATINPQFVVLKDFKCDNRFLYYVLIDIPFQQQIMSITGGSTIPTMSQEKLKNQILLIPSSIDEQRAIAHVLSTMDSDISLLEQKRDKYRQIKQGMMRDLLTGRIRLTDKDSVERKGYTVGLHDHPFDGAIAAEPSPQ